MTDQPWISQTGPRRIAVEGHLYPSGGRCTVLFIEDGASWVLHPFGLDQGAVRLSGAEVRKLAEGLSAA